MAAGENKNPVEEFETAFQNCFGSLVNQENVGNADMIEIKGNAEQSIQHLFEKARQLDQFFVQKRLVLSHHNPQNVVKEDINELKVELMRKDALIQKYYDKLQQWQVMLRNAQGGQEQQGQSSQPANQSPQFQPAGNVYGGQGQQFPQQPPMAGYNGTVSQPQIPPPPQVHQGYPQGPLAFLEQTTSNIR